MEGYIDLDEHDRRALDTLLEERAAAGGRVLLPLLEEAGGAAPPPAVDLSVASTSGSAAGGQNACLPDCHGLATLRSQQRDSQGPLSKKYFGVS